MCRNFDFPYDIKLISFNLLFELSLYVCTCVVCMYVFVCLHLCLTFEFADVVVNF